MSDYRKMSKDELIELKYTMIGRGNFQVATEIRDFLNVYGKTVRVFKGRKVPIGTVGEVFWVKRYNYGKYPDPWGFYSTTKVGIKDSAGEVYFTAIGNVEVIEEEN